MASRPVKLKLAPRATLKLKALARLPASIHGTNGITVTLTGLVYTIGLDTDTGGFVTLTGIQTLTNKTLTSPTINGGTLTSITSVNATLTTPSITGASPLRIRSAGAGAFDLEIKNTETLTAGHSLTVTLNDADRIFNLGGDFTTGGAVSLGAPLSQGGIWYGGTPPTVSVLAKDTNATRYLSNTGSSNAPAWAQVDVSNGVTGDLPFANLTQGAALTVLANATNGTADFAALAAGSDNQVLRRSGTALAFGAVNLASGSAVTGDLPLANVAQISGYSLVGNTTSSTGDIAGFTVGGLTQKATPAGTDLVLIQDQAASGQLKYATVSSVGSSSGVSSIAGNTGAFTLSTGITNSTNDIRLNRGHLPGETTNGSASAGEIGEYIESVIVTGSAVSPSTSVAANITSISLTAGDWDVRAIANYKGGATTTTAFAFASLSTTSATLDTTPGRYFAAPISGTTSTLFTGGNEFAIAIAGYRFSLSGTTTIYLVTQHAYAVSTMSAYGILSARRAR